MTNIKFLLNKAFARWFRRKTTIWGHQMPRSLKAYLNKEITAKDFVIHYHIGGGLMGETDLQLQGDGSYQFWTTATKGRQKKSHSGQVMIPQVEQVVQSMLAAKIWQVRHIYTSPALDDAGAMITVFAKRQKFEIVLWVSEIGESPSFQKVQEQLRDLIQNVSDVEGLESERGTKNISFTKEAGHDAAQTRRTKVAAL